jgi:DNA-binding transcriptional MerR regulator
MLGKLFESKQEKELKEAIKMLEDMGFTNQEIKEALAKKGNNVQLAADYLYKKQGEVVPAKPAPTKVYCYE